MAVHAIPTLSGLRACPLSVFYAFLAFATQHLGPTSAEGRHQSTRDGHNTYALGLVFTRNKYPLDHLSEVRATRRIWNLS